MRTQPKITGMDRIIMSMDPSHKWNEITETIKDPKEVWHRAIGTSVNGVENGDIQTQKANYGKTLDLIWLTQGIIEDLVIHLCKDNPKGVDGWIKAINRAQEVVGRLDCPKHTLRKEWGARVIKNHNSYAEEKICKDLGVNTFAEAKKKLNQQKENN